MSTTLISFIGTGWRKKDSNRATYDTARYDFGKNIVIESPMFFNAILNSKKYDISEAIIIGTTTSAWSTLVEEFLEDTDCEELFLKLEDEIENRGVSEATLSELSSMLAEKRSVTVRCYASEPEIDESNAFDILSNYFAELSHTNNSNILIDVTHGFRSMPILLISALQCNESIQQFNDNIGIIYGELVHNGISPVRYLDAIWRGIELSRATNAFFQKFDATELSMMVNDFWPAGSKALDNLGGSLQGNLLIWLDGPLKQLKNALEIKVETYPKWFSPIKRQLEELYKQLSKPKEKYQLCLKIAEMFAERKIFGQAIIALQLTYETFLFKYYDDENYGDYEITKELLKKSYKLKQLSGEDKNKLRSLSGSRNMIAHGGSRSTHGGKPQAQNLPSQFNSYRDMLIRIINKLAEH